jgi:hypothetical protein
VLGVFEKLILQLKNGLVQPDFANHVDQLGRLFLQQQFSQFGVG